MSLPAELGEARLWHLRSSRGTGCESCQSDIAIISSAPVNQHPTASDLPGDRVSSPRQKPQASSPLISYHWPAKNRTQVSFLSLLALGFYGERRAHLAPDWQTHEHWVQRIPIRSELWPLVECAGAQQMIETRGEWTVRRKDNDISHFCILTFMSDSAIGSLRGPFPKTALLGVNIDTWGFWRILQPETLKEVLTPTHLPPRLNNGPFQGVVCFVQV